MVTRMSRLLAPTWREAPADAELASHRLMLRAGLIRRVGEAAGIYALLPLGLRAVARIEAIIRTELDAIGGQEVLLPIVQPAELWRQSGRWAVYGDEMWRLQDRHGRAYCLAPTHEEVVTDLVRLEVHSWRQLPLLLYQVQNKYRDERRPRFGMLRAREFIMKDGYSFHRDAQDLRRCYEEVFAAYERIFARCGLQCRAVRADAGAMGGGRTHEFMALADAGEAEVLFCTRCDYAADVEEADVALPATAADPPAEGRVAAGAEGRVEGTGGPAAGVAETLPGAPCTRVASSAAADGTPFAARVGVSAGETAQMLFYVASFGEGSHPEVIAAVLPGDRRINEVKLGHAAGALGLRPADANETPLAACDAGPVGLTGVRLFTDRLVVVPGRAWVVGANADGFHLTGVVAGRDFDPGTVASLSMAVAGDPCPSCGAPLAHRRGIEVGQVFELGTKYSHALKAHYVDLDGTELPVVMGCYGIGVTRTLAAVIEQHHDEHGILWPSTIAPYDCVVVPVGAGEAGGAALEAAARLTAELGALRVRAVLDDRDERPGVKFKDADLFGFPERITLGRALADGLVEWKGRREPDARLVPLDAVARLVADRVRAAGGGADGSAR